MDEIAPEYDVVVLGTGNKFLSLAAWTTLIAKQD